MGMAQWATPPHLCALRFCRGAVLEPCPPGSVYRFMLRVRIPQHSPAAHPVSTLVLGEGEVLDLSHLIAVQASPAQPGVPPEQLAETGQESQHPPAHLRPPAPPPWCQCLASHLVSSTTETRKWESTGCPPCHRPGMVVLARPVHFVLTRMQPLVQDTVDSDHHVLSAHVPVCPAGTGHLRHARPSSCTGLLHSLSNHVGCRDPCFVETETRGCR